MPTGRTGDVDHKSPCGDARHPERRHRGECLHGGAADPNQASADSDGRKFTPLWVAAEQGHEAVVARLLAPRVGTDPNQAMNDTGTTPLWMAASDGDEAIVALLLAHGVGTDPNQATNDGGFMPLFVAVQNGHEAVVAQLLAPGVGTDPNQASTDGCTPLSRAAEFGHEASCRNCAAKLNNGCQAPPAPSSPTAVVKLLLAGGADRTVRTKNGTTAEIAAEAGHAAVVELLLK